MLQKLIYHIRTYGIGFTLRLLGSKFFGLRNPFDDLPPEPLVGTFIANHIGREQSYTVKTQPIDSILIPNLPCDRINLVLDSLEENLNALVYASALAERLNGTLRIITRSDYPNPRRYYALMSEHPWAAEQDVEFFSDYDRTLDGQSRFKLSITDRDVFLTASLHTALAAGKTAFGTPVFCLFDASVEANEDTALLLECVNTEKLYFATADEASEALLLSRAPTLHSRIFTARTKDTTLILDFMEHLING